MKKWHPPLLHQAKINHNQQHFKRQKAKFAAKKAAAADKVSELKDKAKRFGGKKFGKVKTKFTKQSGEQE